MVVGRFSVKDARFLVTRGGLTAGRRDSDVARSELSGGKGDLMVVRSELEIGRAHV